MIPLLLTAIGAYLIGDSLRTEKFTKGGKILASGKDFEKFKKADIDDRYTIEAINDIGLGGVKFNKEDILSAINKEFDTLLSTYKSYVINEDSDAITRIIEAEIDARIKQGDSASNIEQYRSFLTDNSQRKRYIDDFAKSQSQNISEWVAYLKKSEYGVAFKYLILKAVLEFNYDYKLDKLIERSNKTIRNFTPFDAGSLSELYAANSSYLLKDYTSIQNGNAAKVIASKGAVKSSGNGKWIKFEGGSKTKEDVISQNAKQLSQLVQNTYWCTKTNSLSQLQGGDFYVYVTEKDGEIFPRIAVRMDGDKVGEVRGNKSSKQDIEEDMLPVAKDFLHNNIPNDSGKKWLDSIDYNERAIQLGLRIREEGIFDGFVEEYFDLLKDEKKYLVDYAKENGNIQDLKKLLKEEIEYFDFTDSIYKRSDFAFDESDFDNEKTKYILGNANFRNSQITNLGKLAAIGGNAIFYDTEVADGRFITKISKITDLGQLATIAGNANFERSEINNLGQLTSIGGNANFTNSAITDLGQLTSIGGNANFEDSKIADLGQLTSIGGNASFYNTEINNLGKLTSIGGTAYFEDSKITDLGQLATIAGNANFERSEINNLGQLTSIGGNANFTNSAITDLGQLTSIGGNANFEDSKIADLGQLTSIGGNADFKRTKIKSLGQLAYIGGDAYFTNSAITDLGQLTSIGRHAYFGGSKITNLGQLTSIGGDAFFTNSAITDLGQLTSIGRHAYFGGSKITNLGQLTSIGGNANFTNSAITDLGQLTSIGGNAYFTNSAITDLGQLTSIGRGADFGGKSGLKKQWDKKQKK